jgi:type II secretory pathway pseudopilin PulG
MMISKKWVTILTVMVVVVILGAVSTRAFLGYRASRNVSFVLSENVESISVLGGRAEGSRAEVATLKASGDVRLKDGNYVVIPAGRDISQDPISVLVNQDSTTIYVNPGYSNIYLAEKLKGELDSAHAVINSNYPTIADGYRINPGRLYGDGSWYGTSIVPAVISARTGTDFYVLLLRKSGSLWKVVVPPQLVIRYADYPDVPKNIIDDLNRTYGWSN